MPPIYKATNLTEAISADVRFDESMSCFAHTMPRTISQRRGGSHVDARKALDPAVPWS
jgi:hypothetical protein